MKSKFYLYATVALILGLSFYHWTAGVLGILVGICVEKLTKEQHS